MSLRCLYVSVVKNENEAHANKPTQGHLPSLETGHTPADAEPQPSSSDGLRTVFQELEIPFQESAWTLECQLALSDREVRVQAWGHPEEVTAVIVRLPIRATPECRAPGGEFLHRLDFCSQRKFREMDDDDGMIRAAAPIAMFAGPLTGNVFRALLHGLITTADPAFPHLTSVLSGRLTPEFAGDQAEAAIDAFWNEGEKRRPRGMSRPPRNKKHLLPYDTQPGCFMTTKPECHSR